MPKPTQGYFIAAAAIALVIISMDLWNIFIQGDNGGILSGLAILLVAIVCMSRKTSRDDK